MADNAPKPAEAAKVAPAKTPTVYSASPKGNEKKARYKVIAGKLFINDQEGNSVRVPIGALIDLTEREAHGRAGQIVPATVEVDAE